jgi:thiol-disulfide isomerase/thioredoxin
VKDYILSALGALLLSTTVLVSAQSFEKIQSENRSSVKEINGFNTQAVERLLKTEKYLIIKFSTETCKYCKYLEPHFKAAAQASPFPVQFVSVVIPSDDATKNWYKSTFQFATVPTVVYYKEGHKMLVHGSENATLKDTDILNNMARIYKAI